MNKMKEDTSFIIILVILGIIVIYLLKTNCNKTIYKEHKPSRFLEKIKEGFTNITSNLSSNIINDNAPKTKEEKHLQKREFEFNKQHQNDVKDFCVLESGVKPIKVIKKKTLSEKLTMLTKCYNLLVDDLYFDIYKNKDTKDKRTKKYYDMRQDQKDELMQHFNELLKKIKEFEAQKEKEYKKLQNKDCDCENEDDTSVSSYDKENNKEGTFEQNLQDYMRLVRLQNISQTY